MRWDNLFDDLESQLAQERSADEIDLRAEDERLRLARLAVRDRLWSIHCGGGTPEERMLRLTLADGSHVCVVPSSFGRDWFSGQLVAPAGRWPTCIVPIDSVRAISLTVRQVSPSLDPVVREAVPSALSERLSISIVLRDLCRRRVAIELSLADSAPGVARTRGTIDRVGRDHIDLAVHEGELRRTRLVTDYRIIPLTQLALVTVQMAVR